MLYLARDFASELFVICCRVVYKLSALGEAGAVAGAIPAVLGAVIFKGAAEVGASWCCGSEKSHCGFKGVDGELWAKDGA